RRRGPDQPAGLGRHARLRGRARRRSPPVTLHAAPRPASAARRAIGVAGRGLQVGGTSWMVVGSLIAGVGAYAFQVVTARGLGEVGYAPISVLWTIQYLLLAVVLYSMESYVTR